MNTCIGNKVEKWEAAGGPLLLGSPCGSLSFDNCLLGPRADSRSQLSGKRRRRGDSGGSSGIFQRHIFQRAHLVIH